MLSGLFTRYSGVLGSSFMCTYRYLDNYLAVYGKDYRYVSIILL